MIGFLQSAPPGCLLTSDRNAVATTPGCEHMESSPDMSAGSFGPSVGDSAPATAASIAFLVAALGALVLVSIWAFTGDGGRRRAAQGTRVGPTDVYNPVTAGERLPDGFRQLLPRDGIRPVYDPTFVSAALIGWSDDTEVIGVADGGEAKAYPVRFLNGRELVNDEINRKPIVVTW